MRKARKRASIVMVVLLIGIMFIKPVSAEKSVTFSASCYMPFYMEMPSGEMILAEDVESWEAIKEAETQKLEKSKIENNEIISIQQEEIISEDNNEIEIIKTVCAK